MTVEDADKIMSAALKVFDRIRTLHLTGGGEPFLHPNLAEMTEAAMKYSDKFDKLMLFTNSLTAIPDKLLSILKQSNKIVVQVSHYGVNPKREQEILDKLLKNGIKCKVEKYYGESQSFGGWVDFGEWKKYGRTTHELENIFQNCAATRVMKGNWRTRDGKMHWCSRSQRGMELGLIPDNPDDYIDLFDDSESIERKREKFERISNAQSILACDYCSGHHGTDDASLRFPAAEQINDESN
jgi:DNA-directed RNA polymerase subunit F